MNSVDNIITVIIFFAVATAIVYLCLRKVKIFKSIKQNFSIKLGVSFMVALVLFGIIMYNHPYKRLWIRQMTATDVIFVGENSDNVYIRQTSVYEPFTAEIYVDTDVLGKNRLNIDKSVRGLALSQYDNLIIASNNNVYSFNIRSKKTEKIYSGSPNLFISSLIADKNSEYIVFTDIATLENDDLSGINYRNYRIGLDNLFSNHEGNITVGKVHIYNTEKQILNTVKFDEKYGAVPVFPSIAKNNTMVFSVNDNILLYDIDKEKTEFLTKGYWAKLAGQGKYMVYLKGDDNEYIYQIYLYDILSRTEKALTVNEKNGEQKKLLYNYPHVFNYNFGVSNLSNFIDISDDGSIIVFATGIYDGMDIKNQRIYVYDTLKSTVFDFAPFKKLESETFQISTVKLSGNGEKLIFTGNGLSHFETRDWPDVYIMDTKTHRISITSNHYKRIFVKRKRLFLD